MPPLFSFHEAHCTAIGVRSGDSGAGVLANSCKKDGAFFWKIIFE